MLVGAAGTPQDAESQQASIVAVARVLDRPLSLRTVTSAAGGAELHVGIDGGGAGTVTVQGRRADGSLVPIARRELDADGHAGRRDLVLPLVHRDSAQIVHFEIRLSQSDALLAPSMAQVVISAAATRTSSRSAFVH